MKRDMHFGAIKPIFENAEFLRKNMTHEEKIVWAHLSNNQLECKFRRQHPIWMYIADFYCHELKLVVEIDGSVHNRDDVKTNDIIRENDLVDFGIKVIRFTNYEVRCDITKVVSDIKITINDIKNLQLQSIKEVTKS
ncbi:endonuclease domain-containing protein [Ferruginibacter sp.]